MKRETPSPKLPSPGDGGTAANHRGALSLSSSLLQPPLRPWESEPGSPHWGLLHSFGFRDLLLTPGAHRSLTPQSGQAAARRPPLQVGPPDKVQTPVGGGSRPFPRVARPGVGSPRGDGRAGAGRRRGSRGRRAGLGARSLPRRAGRWRVGAVAPPAGKLLLALRRLRRSRRGCAGAPRRRSPAICCSRGGGGGGGAGGSSARRGPGTVQLWRARG